MEKRIGGDIIANKKTFLLITALNNATFEDKETLKSWIDAKDFDEQEKIDAVKAIFIKNLVDESSPKINGRVLQSCYEQHQPNKR